MEDKNQLVLSDTESPYLLDERSDLVAIEHLNFYLFLVFHQSYFAHIHPIHHWDPNCYPQRQKGGQEGDVKFCGVREVKVIVCIQEER